jgi:hypothetical protein
MVDGGNFQTEGIQCQGGLIVDAPSRSQVTIIGVPLFAAIRP